MKKKIIIFIAFIFSSSLLFFYFKYVNGWLELRKNTDTPKEFLSNVKTSEENYVNDSIEILGQLKGLLTRHEDFFYSKAYFDSTRLIIDTILYNPDFNKLAALVITKNPTYRQLMPDRDNAWYYDATCYLGVRRNDTISLSWIGPVFTNSFDEQSISNYIREACFRTFVKKDTSNAYNYNLNDTRFWDSPIWEKIEEEKIKKQKFEEEKRKHPENVFEPKR
jgi:hypothetical protein